VIKTSRSLRLLVSVLALLALLSACGPRAEEPNVPQVIGEATATLEGRPGTAQPADAGATFTPDFSSLSTEGFDFEMTGYELVAQSVGRAPYGGHACLISLAPDLLACACDSEVVEHVTFNFLTKDQLHITFEGPGYTAEWDMTRVGPNHWSYSIPMLNNQGDAIGVYTTLLTFTESGYVVNLGADFEGAMVTCPDVPFVRATVDAPALVEEFYTWYLGNAFPLTPRAYDQLSADPTASGLISAGMLAQVEEAARDATLPDPLLCGEANPGPPRAGLLFFAPDQAKVVLNLGDPDNAFIVLLANENGDWRISDTMCRGEIEAEQGGQ